MKFENIIQILKSTQTISFLQFHVIAILEKKLAHTHAPTYPYAHTPTYANTYIIHTLHTYVLFVSVSVCIVYICPVSQHTKYTQHSSICASIRNPVCSYEIKKSMC